VSTSLQQGTAVGVGVELRLRSHPDELGVAREFVQRAALDFGLGAEASFDLVLAANEAVTNAIRHGGPDDHGLILLHTLTDGDRLTLAVRDYGVFVAAPEATPRVDGGRGLAMMRSLTDEFELLSDTLGTTVRLSKDRA
jgi:anti-sigma regulatory factor (Ser/Thr protein kinase)